VVLKPATVEPGGEFAIEVFYKSSSSRAVSFSFTISTGGQQIYDSKPVEVDGTNGAGMSFVRKMSAARNSGSYVIRVTLASDNHVAWREGTLDVSRN
jgi:hypothetical protein